MSEDQVYLTRWQMVGLINLVEKQIERDRNGLKRQYWEEINKVLTIWAFGSGKPIENIKFEIK
jgi:hypothetical protein